MNQNKVNDIILRYFSGELTKKYQNLIQLWLTMGDNKDKKDRSLRHIWKTIEENDSEKTNEAWLSLLEMVTNYDNKQKTILQIKKFIRYAAILLFPIFAATIAWHSASIYYAPTSNMLECEVADGKIKTIMLSDDTRVVLNGGSRILYPEKFSKYGNRNVFVEGEAFFYVSPDKKHPFIANVENIDVKVLGTHFNIRAYRDEDNIITTLEKGRVLVSDGLHRMYLIPNQQAIYNRSKKIISRNIIIANQESQWKTGDLMFDGKPLRMILSSISHKYGVRFEIDSSINLDKIYTLNFKATESIDDVLKILNILQNDNLIFRRKGNIVQIYKERKEVQRN